MTSLTLSAAIGTTMEWYDVIVAAFAASVVWPSLFFPKELTSTGLALSVFIFFITYFARPMGAFIFGHLGDKFGRKQMLIWTLVLMGGGSFAIAIDPPYNSIGLFGPAILIFARILQGIGIGGEFGGANSWILETAKTERRAFWTSIVQASVYMGIALSALIFVVVSSLPHDNFFSYGWRIPFYVGAVMVIIGAVIRYRFMESPIFAKFKEEKLTDSKPSVQVLRKNFRTILFFIPAVLPPTGFVLIPVLPFSISLVTAIKQSPTVAEIGICIGSLVAVAAVVLGGILADKVGRKKVLVVGNALILTIIFPFFLLVNVANVQIILVAYILGLGMSGLSYSVVGTILSEGFGTGHRYSGSGLSYHLMSLVVGIMAGIIIPMFTSAYGGALHSWYIVAIIMSSLTILSIIAALKVKETRGISLT